MLNSTRHFTLQFLHELIPLFSPSIIIFRPESDCAFGCFVLMLSLLTKQLSCGITQKSVYVRSAGGDCHAEGADA